MSFGGDISDGGASITVRSSAARISSLQILIIGSSSPDVLSAALDSSVAVSSILIFFILQYPKNGTIGATTTQMWWGNTVSWNNLDGTHTPAIVTPKGQTFGPPIGSW